MTEKHYELVDPETGQKSTLPRLDPTVGPSVLDIRKIYREMGVFTHDPGFAATSSCESRITYIDGENGVLMYRGYPIEQLAQHSSFVEVAFLLMHGSLPTADELGEFDEAIRTHTMINETPVAFL